MTYILLAVIVMQFLCVRSIYHRWAETLIQLKWHQQEAQRASGPESFWAVEYNKMEEQWRKLLLSGQRQTRIYGSKETERLVADWLEEQHGPFGDDLTDFENTVQIAARIRRGEYLKGQIDENLQA